MRFRFDVDESREPHVGPVEVDLSNAEDARKQAITLLAELAHDALPDGDAHDFSTVVSDEAGKPIFRASLSLRASWIEEGDVDEGRRHVRTTRQSFAG